MISFFSYSTEPDLHITDIHCTLDELLPALEQLLSGELSACVKSSADTQMPVLCTGFCKVIRGLVPLSGVFLHTHKHTETHTQTHTDTHKHTHTSS